MTAAPTLRPYQLAAVDAIRAQYVAGRRSTLLVLATGLGKTVCFAEVARRTAVRGNRTLVLAHRTELLEQAIAKLSAAGVVAELEQGPARAGDTPVVVASVQTLRGARLAGWAPDAFALVVIDEAHHAAAASYQAILAHFASARVLGVTATPDRGDGRPLGEVFESVAFRYELRAAILDGYLAPIVAKRIKVDAVDLGGVKVRAGDLATDQLSNAMCSEPALHGQARPLVELVGDRRTIAFAVDVAHAAALAEVINLYRPGIARAISGESKDRAAILAAFGAGEFQVLLNCQLLTEGYDCPAVSCIAVMRPTKSRALYTQMVGRGTRLAPGKADCLVLHFVGTNCRHRLQGPADALAGADELTDDVRDELEGMLAGDRADLETAIAEATERAQRAAAAAVVTYAATEIDPFIGAPPARPLGRPDTSGPASVKQRTALERFGLTDLPPSLTRETASAWLAALYVRRQRGLCTLKQARWLRRHGIDGRAMTFEAASAAIGDELSAFRTQSSVSPSMPGRRTAA